MIELGSAIDVIQRKLRRVSFAVLAVIVSAITGHAASPSDDVLKPHLFQRANSQNTLDLLGQSLIFSESFSTCEAIDDEQFANTNKSARWFADTVNMGGRDIGEFVGMQAARRNRWPATIDCSLGHLRLTLVKGEDGRWRGAQIKTHSYGGHGLLVRYGYWEVDAMFPPLSEGFVPWAAMWLRDRVATKPVPQTFEFDVFETGMHALDERTFDTTVHRWPASPVPTEALKIHQSASTRVNFNAFDGKRHRYGVLRTKDWHVVYIDGIEQVRFPTLSDDMRTPVALLLDLAIMIPPRSEVTEYSMHVYGVKIYKARNE